MIINNDVKLKSLNVSQMNIYKNNNSSLIDLKEREKEIKSERKTNELNINLKKDLLDKIDIFIENDLKEEELIDENNKIKSVLNDLIFWDNDHLTDRKHKNKSLISTIQKEN